MSICIAVISVALPPSGSGQAIALHRLLRNRDANFWFFSDDPQSLAEQPRMPRSFYKLLRPLLFGFSMRDYPGLLGSLNAHLGAFRPINIRVAEIVKEFRDQRPDVVIGCSGSPFDLAVAREVAKRFDARFIAWLFDDPVFQWPPGRVRDIAGKLERRWASDAHAIICPNERLADALERRTGQIPVIVRNPREDSLVADAEYPRESAGPSKPVQLVYSGALAETQADALANLSRVIELKGGLFKLHVFSRQTKQELRKFGIVGQHVHHHSYLDASNAIAIQKSADILVLPLSFKSLIPEAVMTASPGKMGEYLASGRPILVHAPCGSFVADFMREHRAGFVVSDSSCAALSNALSELAYNTELTRSFVDAAAEASNLFSESKARAELWRVIEVDRFV